MPSIDWNKSIWDGLYSWNSGGEEWSGTWGSSENQWFGSIFPRVHKFLPCNNILEIASGYGRWTKFLIDNAKANFRGIDLSERCITSCREKFTQTHASFYLNDGSSLSQVSDIKYDFVFSFDSLVHADKETLQNYIAQILSLLTPNGVCTIHHSNFHNLVLSGKAIQSDTEYAHSRDQNVSATIVRDFVVQSQGKIICQEIIDWGETKELDCITTFCRSDAWPDLEEQQIINHRFILEAEIINSVLSRYAKTKAPSNPDNIELPHGNQPPENSEDSVPPEIPIFRQDIIPTPGFNISTLPMVSICCLAYNHVGSIEKAIQSFLMQKTDFPVEIFIHDDASTDGTVHILQKYELENPDRIRLLIQPENQYSIGKSLYEIYTQIVFPQLRGKYIAICEGDDFWTDSLKLQKQVHFLEENPDYSVCFHNVGFTGDTETDFHEHEKYYKNVLGSRKSFELSDLIRNNFIPNCSVVYRNCVETFPDLFSSTVFPDWPLHIIFAHKGKIGYLNQIMAVHHKRADGIWEGLSLDSRMKALYRFYFDLLLFAGEMHRLEILNALGHHTKNYKVPDLNTLFDIGFSLGAKPYRLKNEELQSELNLIYSSYTWKTANQLRIISEKILPKETLQRKLAAGIFHYSLKMAESGKNLISGGIRTAKVKNQKLKTIKATNKAWPADKPLVSIIIPSFNYGKYIGQTIQSVLDQTWQNLEIIVVDGGSTDGETIEVLKKLNHPRIRVFLREGKHLVGSNRNFGIEKALGKYVSCLDSDDWIEPTFIEKALFYLEVFNNDVVCSWVEAFGAKTELWKTSPGDFETLTKVANTVATNAVFRKVAWEQVSGFGDYAPGENQIPEDWEFWARLAGHGYRFAVIPEPLLKYRVHDGSLSTHIKKNHTEQLKEIRNANIGLETPYYIKLRRQKSQKVYRVKNPFVNLQAPKTKKRILVALPFMVVGGVDSLFLNVFGHLSKFYDITFYTTVPFGGEYGDNTSLFQKITNEIYHLSRFLTTESELEKFIIYLVETRNFDCMFLAGSSFTYQVLPQIKKQAPRLPVIDFLVNESGHIENNRKYSCMIDMNIVENEKIEALLLQRYHEKAEKIRLIHNGVNIEKYSKKADAAFVKEKYALKDGHFLIAFMGRFSSEKNPLAVVEIAKKLRNQPVEFFMGGHGPVYDEVIWAIQENLLQDKIKTPGFVNSIEILSVADVLILPSTLDGRPNIVIEAMTMGVPVIASNVGGLPGIIKHGETGFLLDADDLDGFAQTILKLKNDDELRESIGKAARKFAEEVLNDKFMHEKYMKVVEDLIGK